MALVARPPVKNRRENGNRLRSASEDACPLFGCATAGLAPPWPLIYPEKWGLSRRGLSASSTEKIGTVPIFPTQSLRAVAGRKTRKEEKNENPDAHGLCRRGTRARSPANLRIPNNACSPNYKEHHSVRQLGPHRFPVRCKPHVIGTRST